ncbi:MAG: serine protease [Pseudomonadota bacterium]
MPTIRWKSIFWKPLVAALLLAFLPPALARTALPRGVKLPKDVKIPNDTPVAIYLPANDLGTHFYVASIGAWAYPGKSLDDARRDLGGQLFPQMQTVTLTDAGAFAEGSYGLLISINPTWNISSGQLSLTMDYKVYDASAQKVLEGSRAQSVALHSPGPLGGFPNAARSVTQLVLFDVLIKLKPNAGKYPAAAQIPAINRELLIDRKKAVTTGTAFYINKSGQMITAAHVLRDCLVLEAQKDGVTLPVKLTASSNLLDLAVVDSGKPTDRALPLRVGETITLGEGVTNVGYPLQGLLADSPNLTRGNVSARAGMKGSVGLFQFSAPIQPGSSGGPVVSDGGELLGITVSSLNAAALIKDGLLPQNVNFALEAKYAAMFLRDSHIDFVEVTPKANGSMTIANEAALGAVLQLSCFQ